MKLPTIHSRRGLRFALALVTAAAALAGMANADYSANGITCQPAQPEQYDRVTYSSVGAGNVSETDAAIVVCPMSADENLGAEANFTIHVFDNSPSTVFCAVWSYDENGELLASSSIEATPDPFVGATEIEISVDSADLGGSYVVICSIPEHTGSGSLSQIRSIQVN